MLVAQKENLQTMVGLIDKIAVDPDVSIDYFIPGVLVTDNADGNADSGGPYVKFAYDSDGQGTHIQHMPLTRSYLEKTPQDLANLITFSLERFMEEIDSRQYGAQ